jgi:hypothetical protein
MDCLYNKCKALCPICDRELLNQPICCHSCDKYYHVKDTTMCYLCNNCYCEECFSYHDECPSVFHSNRHLPLITGIDDILSCLDKRFIIIGNILMSDNTYISVVKDYIVKNNSSVLLFIWDSSKKNKELIQKKKLLKMKSFEFSTLHRGVKTYNVHKKNFLGLQHIRNFYNLIINQ